MGSARSSRYDPLYVQFLYHFNIEQDYYECHDYMEELWLEEGRFPLYQGLLQAAVGLYHFDNNNLSGAVKLMEAGIAKMKLHETRDIGINLEKFISECEQYLVKLQQFEQVPFEFYPLYIEITDAQLAAEIEQQKTLCR